MSFFFGQTPSLTPEGAAKKRQLADAFAASIGSPRNLGEGLSAVGKALAARGLNRQAEGAEKTGRERASELFSSLISGNPKPYASDTGPLTMAGIPARSEEQVIGDDTMAALGRDDAMSIEGRIRKGLIDRNMPEHVADAFIMNFRDESGLNPGINEQNPIVPGSRGGFGLAQWTGPRRKQLEAFAAERGKPASDLDTQLDFLMTELQGPEAAAGRAILSSRNAPEAAAAIVNDFLRPAEEHRARREARYLGNTSATSQVDNSRLYAALADPWLDQTQKSAILAMIQQNQQASDPLRQLQLEKAQVELDMLRNPQAEKTALMRNYDAAVAGGYEGDFVQYQTDIKKAGASQNNITVGGDAAVPAYPKAPNGYMYVRDPATGQVVLNEQGIATMAPIVGGPEDTSAEEANAEKIKQTSANLVMDEIAIAKDLIAGESTFSPATGISGSLAANVDSTRAGALKNRLMTIKANIGFDKLQSMRDASPTGGALGQVSEFENRLLQSVFGSLEQAQKAEDIVYNLERLEAIYNRIIHEGIPDDEARDLYRQIELGEDNTGVSDEDLFKQYGLD